MPKLFDTNGSLERAMAAFEAATGLRTQYANLVTNNAQLAPLVDVYVDRQPIRFEAQVKAVERFQTLTTIHAKADDAAAYPGLLVAPYVSQALAARCRALRLPFIDEAGNAYIEAPGLFVYVTGQSRPVPAVAAPNYRSLTSAGLKIVFALLHQPRLLAQSYREVAKAAKVALGTVGEVLADLERRGFLIQGPTGARRWLARERLQEEWMAHYPIKLRPKLSARRFTGAAPDWWRTADVTLFQACWGGEVAAAKLTDYLKPACLCLYLAGPPDRLILANRLRPDAQGEIEILEAFWDTTSEQPAQTSEDCAPPLVVIADLMASFDARNMEAAQLIRERYLA
jgi:hypothetical protein